MTAVSSPRMSRDHPVTTRSAKSTAINMRIIERVVTEAIQTHPVSDEFEAEFVVEHDIHGFKQLCHDWYNMMVPLRIMTVLTGSALRAQAIGCGNYVQRIWPETGLVLVDVFEKALASMETNSYTAKTVISGCSPTINIQTYPYYYVLSIKAASSDVILDLTQLLAWIGSAIPTPGCSGEMLTASSPVVENKTLERYDPKLEFKISFRTAPLHGTENLSWLSLFKNTNIAYDFPVPNRGGEIGLELSYEDFDQLITPYKIFHWEEGVVFLTSNMTFVPIKKVDDRVQWHVIVSRDMKNCMEIEEGILRFESSCMPRALEEEFRSDSPSSTRFFLA